MLWNLPHILVPVEPIFTIGPITFTSTLLLAIVDAILVFVIFYLFSRRKKILPGRVQGALEWLVQSMLNLCEEVAGKVKGRRFFPWVFGIFLFVLMGNLWEVIPGIETFGAINHELPGCENAAGFLLVDKNISNCITPWLRPPSTDLNFTLAIAVISVVITQVYGWRMLGARANRALPHVAGRANWPFRRPARSYSRSGAHHLVWLPSLWQPLRRRYTSASN